MPCPVSGATRDVVRSRPSEEGARRGAGRADTRPWFGVAAKPALPAGRVLAARPAPSLRPSPAGTPVDTWVNTREAREGSADPDSESTVPPRFLPPAASPRVGHKSRQQLLGDTPAARRCAVRCVRGSGGHSPRQTLSPARCGPLHRPRPPWRRPRRRRLRTPSRGQPRPPWEQGSCGGHWEWQHDTRGGAAGRQSRTRGGAHHRAGCGTRAHSGPATGSGTATWSRCGIHSGAPLDGPLARCHGRTHLLAALQAGRRQSQRRSPEHPCCRCFCLQPGACTPAPGGAGHHAARPSQRCARLCALQPRSNRSCGVWRAFGCG